MKSLLDDFSDGILLAKFVESSVGRKFSAVLKDPKTREDRLENVNRSLNCLISSQVIEFDEFSAVDIVDKNEKVVCNLIWRIILDCYSPNYNVHNLLSQPLSLYRSMNRDLFKWISGRIQPYGLTNFRGYDYDFTDGRVFASLIHSHRPDLINLHEYWFSRDALDKSILLLADHYSIAPLFTIDQLKMRMVDSRLLEMFAEDIRENMKSQTGNSLEDPLSITLPKSPNGEILNNSDLQIVNNSDLKTQDKPSTGNKDEAESENDETSETSPKSPSFTDKIRKFSTPECQNVMKYGGLALLVLIVAFLAYFLFRPGTGASGVPEPSLASVFFAYVYSIMSHIFNPAGGRFP